MRINIVRKVQPPKQLHYDELLTLRRYSVVEYADHVRAVDAGYAPCLLRKPRARVLVDCARNAHDLHGHLGAQGKLLCQPYGAHGTVAEFALQAQIAG